MSATIERDSHARRDRGEIWLGDAITAIARLGAMEPRDARLVVDALGLDVAPVAPVVPVVPVAPVETTTADATDRPEPTDAPEPARPSTDETSPAVEPPPAATPVSARLSHVDEPDEPAWLHGIDGLEFGVARLAPVAPDPPLEPIRARAAMTLLAATRRQGRRLDVARLVQRAARAQPQIPAPLVHELRTASSVQLLVDVGEPMEPYVADIEFLADAFGDVAGRERVAEHAFIGSPLRGVDPDPFDGATTRWDIPPPRSLVVVISDLGVGRSAAGRERGTVREWQQFAATLADHEAVLRVLTPFAERCPEGIEAVAQIIAWEHAVDLVSIRA